MSFETVLAAFEALFIAMREKLALLKGWWYVGMTCGIKCLGRNLARRTEPIPE